MTDNAKSGDLINAAEIKPFEPIKAQLAELKQHNDTLVFDYESKAGNKQARSHVNSIRLVKGNLERARKEAKQAALEYGRAVDKEAKSIEDELEAMISVHANKLAEIELREQKRIADINAKLSKIRDLGAIPTNGGVYTSEQVQQYLSDAEAFHVGEEMAEFTAEAASLKQRAILDLASYLDTVQQREADALELENLRKEKAAREEREREERQQQEELERKQALFRDQLAVLVGISRGCLNGEPRKSEVLRYALSTISISAEWGELEAEASNLHKAAAEYVEKLADEEAKKAAIQRELEEEERKAREQKELAEHLERQRNQLLEDQAAAQKKLDEERERRERNKKHREKVGKEAIAAIVKLTGLSEHDANLVVSSIAAGSVPHISITF